MKVTLHQVASKAGVSIATVSRTVNGKFVAKESRERVERAITELGYVANQQARALKSDRTMTMGLLLFDFTSPRNIGFIEALSGTLEERGYSLLISTARGDPERYDHLLRRFLERRVDGMFCSRPQGQGRNLVLYKASNVPIITLFSSAGGFAKLPLLKPSFDELAEKVVSQLKGLKHRRVAILKSANDAMARPLDAIAQTLRRQAMDVDVADSDPNIAQFVLDWKASSSRPSAVIASSQFARSLRITCEVARIRIPNELSLISVGELEGDIASHDLSSWVIEHEHMGHVAARTMFGLLEGVRTPNIVNVASASYHARGTTGEANGRGGVRT